MLSGAVRRAGRPPGRRQYRALLADLAEDAEEDEAPQALQGLEHARQMAALARRNSFETHRAGRNPGSCDEQLVIPDLAIGSELQQMLAKAAGVLQHATDKVSENMRQMFHRLFRKQRPVSSFTAEAQSMECDRKQLAAGLQQGACLLVQLNGYLMGSTFCRIAALIEAEVYKPLLLCLRRKYDETPSKISVNYTRESSGVKQRQKESNATAKVLQTRCEVSLLLRNVVAGRYVFLEWFVPTRLQAVDRTTAETTRKTQEDLLSSIACLPEVCRLFPTVVHQVCTDRYAANTRAELDMTSEAVRNNTMPGISSHYYCDVHKLAGVQTKTLRFVSGHVSALIAGALALGESGCLRLLRKALLNVLRAKVKVLFGAPPQDNYTVSYRQAVLDAFLPLPSADALPEVKTSRSQKNTLLRRYIVSFYLNGDLQEHEDVSFWTTDFAQDREQVLAAMDRYLIPALLPSKPPMFFRSKWTGFQGSYEYFGLLDMCHGLLAPTILEYFGTTVPEQVSAPSAEQAGVLADRPVPGEQDRVGEAGAPQREDQDADAHMDVVTDNVDWKAFNVKMKQRLRIWVQSNPGPILAVVSAAMKPLLGLMQRMLYKGSKAWEKQEQAKAAQGGSRTFPVLDAANLVDLSRFRDEVSAIFHRRIVAMPRAQHFLQRQNLLFRMLSTAASSGEFYLYTSWRGFPVQMFRCLQGDFSMAHAKQCLLCPLSKLILQQYPNEEALQTEDCQAVLRSLAAKFAMDISDLESRHASTRRINTVRSVQVSRTLLTIVSADWACRCNRNNRKEVLSEDADADDSGKPPILDDDQKAEKVHRANPWYAFLSDVCKKKFVRADMKSLAERFQSIPTLQGEKVLPSSQVLCVALCCVLCPALLLNHSYRGCPCGPLPVCH